MLLYLDSQFRVRVCLVLWYGGMGLPSTSRISSLMEYGSLRVQRFVQVEDTWNMNAFVN